MKGIILAGGKATRLYPITKTISKQLLPVYDKPMIYYPLSVLMLANIKEILIISTPEALPLFKKLLGDGSQLGIQLSYEEQTEPRGLADAFIVGEKFIGKSDVTLILGDNLFFGDQFVEILKEATNRKGASIFGYYVKDPQNFGVIELDKDHKILSIEEKPNHPKSNWAVTGLYIFDNDVIAIAKTLKPSKRGELEITDIIQKYHDNKKLHLSLLGRGYAWLDTGSYSSLIDAAVFIKAIEERQGLKIGCIEEVAFRTGFINAAQLKNLAPLTSASYGEYLIKIAKEGRS